MKTAQATDASILDHLKSIKQYLGDPHPDDPVWRGNMQTEAQGISDDAERGRAVHEPGHGQDVYKDYLAALDDYSSGAEEMQKALGPQDTDWMKRALARLQDGATAMPGVRDRIKELEDTLTATMDSDTP
jgi:hypothetical protein